MGPDLRDDLPGRVGRQKPDRDDRHGSGLRLLVGHWRCACGACDMYSDSRDRRSGNSWESQPSSWSVLPSNPIFKFSTNVVYSNSLRRVCIPRIWYHLSTRSIVLRMTWSSLAVGRTSICALWSSWPSGQNSQNRPNNDWKK